MPSADHAKGGGTVEITAARQRGYRYLAGVYRVIECATFLRCGANAQHAIFGVHNNTVFRTDIIRNQGGNTDSKIDDVAFFQFGVGLAQDRETPWESYVRTLAVSSTTRFTARLMAAALFAFAAVAIVIVLAVTLTEAGMAPGAWLAFVVSVMAAAVPASLLGIAVGYWASPKAALPVANILYLGMSFGGGLFIPPDALPDFVDRVSVVLPTRQFGELAWSSVLGVGWPLSAWLWVAGYTVLFGTLAVWGYRRDEGGRYR